MPQKTGLIFAAPSENLQSKDEYEEKKNPNHLREKIGFKKTVSWKNERVKIDRRNVDTTRLQNPNPIAERERERSSSKRNR